jgi:hypothetical protein
MALPANLYAIPELPAPKRKLNVVEKREEVKLSHDREMELKQNIERCDRVLTKLEERRARRTAFIRALQKRNAADDARIAKIEDRTLTWMTANRIDKACGLRTTFTAKPNPASLVVDNESLIPAEYLNEKVVTTPDKVAIKTALAKGVEFPEGAVHLEQGVSLIRK